MINIKNVDRYVDRRVLTLRLIYSLLALAFLSLIFLSYENAGRVILLVESLLFFVILAINYQVLSTRSRLAVLLLNLLSLTLTAIFYSGLGSILTYFNLLSAFYVFNNISLTQKELRNIRAFTACLLLAYFLTSNIGSPYSFSELYGVLGNRVNSNIVGMLMLALTFNAANCLGLLFVNKKYRVFLVVLTLLTGGYFIYLSKCRSAMISLAVLTVLLLFWKKPMGYKVYKILSVAVLIFSLAITVIYVAMYNSYSELEILGKKLFTGREIVWRSAFERIRESAIIGNGNSVALDTVGGKTTVSAHNMLLSIWYTIGIIPMLTTVLFFVNRLDKKNDRPSNTFSRCAFIASLFVGFFEGFYTDSTLQMFFLVLLLSNLNTEDERNDTKEDPLLLVRGKAAERAGKKMRRIVEKIFPRPRDNRVE